jgi:ribosomal protein S18 acetylase RimI-like enzyme
VSDITPIRMRKALDTIDRALHAPPGIHLQPMWQADPVRLHRLLQLAYANGGGKVGDFDAWFWPLVEDEEFDPSLVLIAADDAGEPLGLAQCWTSGFLKDLVVHPDHRNRRIGAWLLHQAVAAIRQRGLHYLDLKVEAGNSAARRFYSRHGMVEID